MASIQITNQALEHVLTSPIDYHSLGVSALFTAIGSFCAAGLVALYSERSLNKRDKRLELQKSMEHKKQVEAAINVYSEQLFHSLSELHGFLISNPQTYPRRKLMGNIAFDSPQMLLIAECSPEAFSHTCTFASSHNKVNEWLESDKQVFPEELALRFAKEAYAHALCSFAWLQRHDEYNMAIISKPYLYMPDKSYGIVDELKDVIKQSIETTSREKRVDAERFALNYKKARHSLLDGVLFVAK